MLIAVLTDIHGNREALSAVLDDCAARSVGRFVCLGDIVGYGPDPEWCVDRVRDLVAAGAVCVQGNHDSAIANPGENLNPVARAAIDWTRPRLPPGQRDFLAGLPLVAELGDALFVHASAHNPGDWIYVTGEMRARPSFNVTAARLIVCGHVHQPALYSCDLRGRVYGHAPRIGAAMPLLPSRRWLAVAGAVGQPRDGVPQAGYLLYDTAANELVFRRVAYDTAETARKLRAAGLPEALALRVLAGR
ncbi:metallophosphoesterase family protein [Ruixingdingia sedimenti]|uniref:Metallophosphoesterase family protein n=1 Tax=Ruixingdingia sedimenti TaxID=3073604 RepID=A0ABU1F2H1_9RHOB|nr:metallophosphoesterase family protein [Xinfangfangia sp. LG-4]MDR5651051.1 metallophosphoesterase family protein [Xinfangfangia sp. LG-4]